MPMCHVVLQTAKMLLLIVAAILGAVHASQGKHVIFQKVWARVTRELLIEVVSVFLIYIILSIVNQVSDAIYGCSCDSQVPSAQVFSEI